MIDTPALDTISLPVTADADGILSVAGTRVTVDTLLFLYRDGGMTIDELVSEFPAVPPAAMHAIVTYYLEHEAEVNAWRNEIARQKDSLRQQIEAAMPPRSREELYRRLEERRRQRS